MKARVEESRPFDMESSMRMETDVMFTQMQATQGIKLFGERAVATIVKELKQLEYGPIPRKKVVMAVDYDNHSVEDSKCALNTVNSIKEKRNGTIKGRTCANGSKRRRYLSPENSVASPMVSLEA